MSSSARPYRSRTIRTQVESSEAAWAFREFSAEARADLWGLDAMLVERDELHAFETGSMTKFVRFAVTGNRLTLSFQRLKCGDHGA